METYWKHLLGGYKTSTPAAQEKYFQEVREAIQAMREELKADCLYEKGLKNKSLKEQET